MPEYSLSPSGEKVRAAREGGLRRRVRAPGAPRAARRATKARKSSWSWGSASSAPSWPPSSPTRSTRTGRPTKFVIGCQRPSTRSYWKIPLLNRGISPVKAEDPEVDPMIARCVIEKKTLTATFNSDCLKLADCVVVDVQCDYVKQELGNMRTGEADMAALEATLRTIGERIRRGLPRPDRDDRRPRHDRVRRLADPQEGVRRARPGGHAAARPQLRARHAGARVRGQHPRLLARLQRLHARGAPARREVPARSPQHRAVPAHGHGPADRIRDDQDRRELLPRDDPRLPRRVEHFRRAQRRRPSSRSSTRSRCARPTAT